MTEIAILTAKIAVLELLLASTMIELSKISPHSTETLRHIMMPVEDQLRTAEADAPEGQGQLAKAAHAYFKEISFSLLSKTPHHGKH